VGTAYRTGYVFGYYTAFDITCSIKNNDRWPITNSNNFSILGWVSEDNSFDNYDSSDRSKGVYRAYRGK
jgi:hypothetical protein